MAPNYAPVASLDAKWFLLKIFEINVSYLVTVGNTVHIGLGKSRRSEGL